MPKEKIDVPDDELDEILAEIAAEEEDPSAEEFIEDMQDLEDTELMDEDFDE
jgi:hypothetical protein